MHLQLTFDMIDGDPILVKTKMESAFIGYIADRFGQKTLLRREHGTQFAQLFPDDDLDWSKPDERMRTFF